MNDYASDQRLVIKKTKAEILQNLKLKTKNIKKALLHQMLVFERSGLALFITNLLALKLIV